MSCSILLFCRGTQIAHHGMSSDISRGGCLRHHHLESGETQDGSTYLGELDIAILDPMRFRCHCHESHKIWVLPSWILLKCKTVATKSHEIKDGRKCHHLASHEISWVGKREDAVCWNFIWEPYTSVLHYVKFKRNQIHNRFSLQYSYSSTMQ